jgi:integrase
MWKREPLEEDELQILLDAAESTDLDNNVTCRTLAYTGLRTNEFANLTESWIDWQGERLRVPRVSDE